MKTYQVTVMQTVTSTKLVIVEAENEEAAEVLACAEACEMDWEDEETNTDWEAVSVDDG